MHFYFQHVTNYQPRQRPRRAGLTMVADWGLGRHAQQDLLDVAAGFFDFAKIAVGIGGLLRPDLLDWKIKTYQTAGIDPFPGGQFLEYAYVHGVQDAYLPAVAEAGFRWCEVSDNLADVTLQWKQQTIQTAIQRFGLKVLGEVGRKEGKASDRPMVDDARACLDAGAGIILLEAAELVVDDPAVRASVEQVVAAVGLERVMFELPGPWIRNVHHCDIHAMRAALISRFGPQVNLGNVHATDLVSLEAYRCGLGVNAGHPRHSAGAPAEA
jgi:phosphosulfolactate synthase